MSLPSFFESPFEYFRAATLFLKEFSWIYSTSNTRFLAGNVLDNFPSDWTEYFASIDAEDLRNFPNGNELKNLPSSLKDFQKRTQNLKSRHELYEFRGNDTYFKGMSPKKLHEISRLSNFVGNTCHSNVDIFIDFGSGLGYLSEILHRQYKFNVLGLECEEARVKAAEERQKTYCAESKENVYYKKVLITEDSSQVIMDITNKLYDKIVKPRLAIIGLHACADLSITSMKLFFQIQNVQKLIIMPCCYHKLKLSTDSLLNRSFVNFPISKAFLEIFNKTPESSKIFNRPFLRLACQETVSRWNDMSQEKHVKHANEMFIRSVVECLPETDEFICKVRKKSYKISGIENGEQHAFEDIKIQYQIQKKLERTAIAWNQNHELKYNDLLLRHKNGRKLAEGLTCLQTTLQEVCENLLLFDRVAYMQEQGEELGIKVNVYVVKLMEDKLSPRCFALVAEKSL